MAASSTFHACPFAGYQLDEAWDEMFDPSGEPRPHYRDLYSRLLTIPPDQLRQRKQAADLAFFNQSITFTVYGREEGTERIFPHDLLPRIISNAEWREIEAGLTQRSRYLTVVGTDLIQPAGRTLCRVGGQSPRAQRSIVHADRARDR